MRPQYADVGRQCRSVGLSEILNALSHALDITDGQPLGHSQRCAWIGHHLGVAYGLDEAALAELYFTILMKDLGCSSNSARLASVFKTDERLLKHRFKLVDGTVRSVMRFTVANTATGGGPLQRTRALFDTVRNIRRIAHEVIDTRCHRGADIAAKLRLSPRVQAGIRSLDEHWDGGGQPEGLVGDAIPLFSRIALMAQVVDVFHQVGGPDAATAEIAARSGTWFDPELATLFSHVGRDPTIWAALTGNSIALRLKRIAPASDVFAVDDAYLDEIAEAFADVVDAKSPFTAGHSRRVMGLADAIAGVLDFDRNARRSLRRAALLHDIGKLGVGNDILDKPGKPTEDEWQVIRSHPVHSRTILAQVPVLADLLSGAGGHHEKLDGSGYPHGLTAEEIDVPTRILTVADVFDALSQNRPYRPALPDDEALAIISGDVGPKLDAACYEALTFTLDHREEALAA